MVNFGSLLFRQDGSGVSKLKLGGILGTIGGILTTVGGMLTGTINFEQGLMALLPLLGVLFGVAGLRDALPTKK